MTDLDRLIALLQERENEVRIAPKPVPVVELAEDKEHWILECFGYDDPDSCGFVGPFLYVNEKRELLALAMEEYSIDEINHVLDTIVMESTGERPVFPQLKLLALTGDGESAGQISASLHAFSHIEYLRLRGMQLRELPDWLQDFKGLKELRLEENDLTTLPEWIGELEDLEVLALRSNPMRCLPDCVKTSILGGCLKVLMIDENKLQTLPVWLRNYYPCELLTIDGNPFETISPTLLDLLEILTPTKNVHVADVPDEILQQGWAAVKRYYASLVG
jgi:hypothetical protein